MVVSSLQILRALVDLGDMWSGGNGENVNLGHDLPLPTEILIQVIDNSYKSYVDNGAHIVFKHDCYASARAEMARLCLVSPRWTTICRSYMYRVPTFGCHRSQRQIKAVTKTLEVNPEWCHWVQAIGISLPRSGLTMPDIFRLLLSVKDHLEHLAILRSADKVFVNLPALPRLKILQVYSNGEDLTPIFPRKFVPSSLESLTFHNVRLQESDLLLFPTLALKTLLLSRIALPAGLRAILPTTLKALSMASAEIRLLIAPFATLVSLNIKVDDDISLPELPCLQFLRVWGDVARTENELFSVFPHLGASPRLRHLSVGAFSISEPPPELMVQVQDSILSLELYDCIVDWPSSRDWFHGLADTVRRLDLADNTIIDPPSCSEFLSILLHGNLTSLNLCFYDWQRKFYGDQTPLSLSKLINQCQSLSLLCIRGAIKGEAYTFLSHLQLPHLRLLIVELCNILTTISLPTSGLESLELLHLISPSKQWGDLGSRLFPVVTDKPKHVQVSRSNDVADRMWEQWTCRFYGHDIDAAFDPVMLPADI
ncbi:hypothetical protein BT69DRAFT_1318817 [Atractiella rhizophila]|nr:hypothetical protein BT69DRAFT_1318817 [Atractiella rhizophila]